MLIYIENGVEFTYEYGDINEEFYDKVIEMLDEFSKLLKTLKANHFIYGSRKGYLRFEKRRRELVGDLRTM